MKVIPALLILLVLCVPCEAQTARNFRVTTFAALGNPTEGNVRWCTDCNATAPASGGGTGAFCYATGSAWNCTDHASGGGGGGVSSVGLSLPNIFSVSGSPVTSSGTLTGTLAAQSANRIFAGPTTGAASTPAFRALVAADLGTGTADSTKFLRGDLTWQTALGSVTSVALAAPAEFTVSGSPITGAGTLTLTKATQSANLVYAGPSSGSAAQPGFRSLVAADLPSIAEAKFLFSDITTANSSTVMHGLLPKLSGNGSDCLRGDGSWLTCESGGGGGGSGDFSTNTTTSVANQVVVASGTGGKTGTFFTGTGIGNLSGGILSGITTSAGIAGAISDETGSPGVLVFSNSPSLTTPTIGNFSNAVHGHTGASSGGQLALNAFSSSTGSGAVVGQTSAVLVTPNIGVATATSVNKVAITAPATSATLTIANGKTLTANNSIAFSGTDGTTQTFQASDTIVGRATTDTLTNKTHTLPILGGNSGLPATCTVGQRVRDTSVTPNTYYNCIQTNVWGQELVSGTVGAVTAANGGTGLASGDAAGTISVSGATSGTKTFSTTLAAVPKCIVVPTSDLGGTRYWITKSTTTLTVNTSASVTASFDYHCTLIP